MARRFLVGLAGALAACAARGNVPRPPWVELARAESFVVSYDPRQLRLLPDGALEAKVRLHYPRPAEGVEPRRREAAG